MTTDSTDVAEPDAPVVDDDVETILDAWQPHTVPATITLDPNSDPPRTATFLFGPLGRIRYEQLIGEHPPTEEQQKKARQAQLDRGTPPSRVAELRWNADTFPIELLAASAVKPTMTISQARRLWDDPRRNAGELDKLFSAAVLANESPAQVRLGKGFEEILASGSS